MSVINSSMRHGTLGEDVEKVTDGRLFPENHAYFAVYNVRPCFNANPHIKHAALFFPQKCRQKVFIMHGQIQYLKIT